MLNNIFFILLFGFSNLLGLNKINLNNNIFYAPEGVKDETFETEERSNTPKNVTDRTGSAMHVPRVNPAVTNVVPTPMGDFQLSTRFPPMQHVEDELAEAGSIPFGIWRIIYSIGDMMRSNKYGLGSLLNRNIKYRDAYRKNKRW